MELIDRRKLLKHLSDWWLSETPSGNGEILFINGVPQKTPIMKVIEECIKAVEDQPIAYDIDKVAEQLRKKAYNCGSHMNIYGEKAEWMAEGYYRAFEIVKKGGVADET